jgi:hypothetical protein
VETSQTLITIDLGRAIPYAGAVLDLSLNLVVGIEVGGELSVEITPTLTMMGDFGISGYYEFHAFRSDDRQISAYFNMPTKQPGISAKMTGTLSVEPYAEANISAGIRGVAPGIAKVYVRGGVALKGEISTGWSYATKFREVEQPSTWAEGPVVKTSAKYWESCDINTRRTNGGSCSCASDKTQTVSAGIFGSKTIVVQKCVQRGTPVEVKTKALQIPQRCVSDPEVALGLNIHARAGAKTSSEGMPRPLSGWMSFIDKDFAFFDKEWPIWSYPSKDGQDDSKDLTGCKDIN